MTFVVTYLLTRALERKAMSLRDAAQRSSFRANQGPHFFTERSLVTHPRALDCQLQMFNYFIERVMEKIRATYEVPVPQGKLALKAALRASLEITP